jgi:DNA-binding winged helix-turn-helix (wHTH) protein/Tol biopolymer transport system component
MSTTELPVPPPRVRRPTLAFGPFTFDPDNHLLRRGPDDIAAPPRVLGVLDLLLERAGDLVARQDLIDRVWKDAFVTDTSLAEAVSALRQILGDEPQSPTYIQTVHRRGYRFVAPVEARGRRAAATERHGSDAPTPDEVVSPSIGGALLPWSLAVLCGLLAGAAIFQLTHRQEPPLVSGRFSIQLDAGQRFDSRGSAVALSPDGARAAWAACVADSCRIYVRPLDRLDASALSGTEDAASPFYSPDGAWLGFFAGGKLRKISLSGGAPTTIADVAQPLGAAWTVDGRIIFGSSLAGGLWQVSDNGGTPEPLTMPRQEEGEVRHAWPSLAPDGRTIFFSIATTLEEDGPSRLGVGTLQGRSRLTSWATLLAGVGIARPMAEDLIVLARGAELQAVSFDPVRRVLVGVPQTLVPAVASVEGRAQFAVSTSGSLLYLLPDVGRAGSPRLGWLAGGGPVRPVPDLEVAGVPALSGDGRRIAWAGPGDGARADIRVGDLDRGAVTRLTHDGLNTSPLWSADGRRLYFARREDRLFRIASIDADGGDPSLLAPAAHHAFPGSVSADGRALAFVVAGQDTKRDLWVVDTAGASPPREVVHSAFDETAPAFSPDGSLLAYQSDEGGRWDVYVQRIGDGRRAIVSTIGGERPFWAVDGASIVYRSGTSLMRATVGADSLTVGSPSRVVDLHADIPLGLAPDGRVLVDHRAGFTGTSAVIVLHWDREARRLLGPPAGTMPR